MISAIKKGLCFTAFLLCIGLTNVTAEASDAYVPNADSEFSAFTPLHQQMMTQNTLINTIPKASAVPEVEQKEVVVTVSTYDAELLAKTIYGEARGVAPVEQAAVAWCILNRADVYGVSVEAVVTAPYQFLGYSEYHPVDPEIYAIAVDVLTRHAKEQMGETDVGRVLPSNYLWFSGDMVHNYFRDGYSLSANRWDFSLPNPYAV